MARIRRIGEFELIARYFAPLARGFKGAGGLKSDNAFLPADPHHDLVVKTDTIVSGVHFLADEKPEFVAAKALRVCLSDLAAGGADAVHLSALPVAAEGLDGSAGSRASRAGWRPISAATASCCAAATPWSRRDRSPSPSPLSGACRAAAGSTRAGARAGDELWVSGTIGDGALGLLAARGRLDERGAREALSTARSRARRWDRAWSALPSAAADVSDGLLADAGHIAEASRLGACSRA